MRVTRRSQLSGKLTSMDLPVTKEQMIQWNSGASYVQDIFPDLSREHREFIKTGITPQEWDEFMGPEPEE